MQSCTGPRVSPNPAPSQQESSCSVWVSVWREGARGTEGPDPDKDTEARKGPRLWPEPQRSAFLQLTLGDACTVPGGLRLSHLLSTPQEAAGRRGAGAGGGLEPCAGFSPPHDDGNWAAAGLPHSQGGLLRPASLHKVGASTAQVLKGLCDLKGVETPAQDGPRSSQPLTSTGAHAGPRPRL